MSNSLAITRLFLSLSLPKVWTVHNLVPHTRVFRDDLAVTHLYLDRVDVAVWHTARVLQDAKRTFEERGMPGTWSAEDFVVPLLNYNGFWPDTISSEEARRRLGLPSGSFVAGHFAPNHPYKGTVRFLEAIRHVRRPDTTYCVFGETKDLAIEQAIRRAATELPNLRIHLERVPDDELQVWFKACDVLVQPYTQLTTSAAVYFPTAFRRPLIATPVGNIPDLVIPGETGWLVQDSSEIPRLIEEAADDVEKTRLMGERAFERAERIAGVDLVAREHVALYERAVALRHA